MAIWISSAAGSKICEEEDPYRERAKCRKSEREDDSAETRFSNAGPTGAYRGF